MEEESRQLPVRNSNFTRGRFISLGLSMGAGAAFVACSSSETPTDGGGSSGGSSNPPDSGAGDREASQGGSAEAIVAASEVPVGESYSFEDGGQPAVLIHQDDDQFVAYSAVCTHQGCTVEYQDAELVCPCHGSVFDPASGDPTTGPANTPLPPIDVTLQGGEVVRA